MPVFRSFEAENVIAVYDEPNQVGLLKDFDAPRNAPAKFPQEHVPAVVWHIDFSQYELAMPIQTVSVNHPSLSGRTKYWGQEVFYGDMFSFSDPIRYQINGRTAQTQHTLVTHNLGYVPLAFVAYDGRMVMPGVAVQIASQGRNRFVCPFATDTIVGLREVYNASQNALGSVSRNYSVMVFRIPAAEAARKLFGREGDNVVMGRGKVDTSRQYLRQLGAGASPFSMDFGKTVDINNGRSRIATGGSVTTEAGYGGSHAAPPFVSVGV